MRSRSLQFVVGTAVVAVLGVIWFPRASRVPTADTTPRDAVLSPAPDPSIPFVPNLGQWDHPAAFVYESGSLNLLVEGHRWMVELVELVENEPDLRDRRRQANEPAQEPRTTALRFSFDDGNPAAKVTGEDELAGYHNYFLGNDASRWRTHVPRFASVLTRDVYPGIDVRLRNGESGPEYDLLLAPGTRASTVRIRVEGAHGLTVQDDGSLRIETALGPLVQPVPDTWQVAENGEPRPVSCTFVVLDREHFGFVAEDLDPELALVIDPPLQWSTYMGGNGVDDGNAIIAHADDTITIVGTTPASGLPTTPNAYTSTGAGASAMISRMDPSAAPANQLIYSTYLGGSADETAFGVSLDQNEVYSIAGSTASTDFPTTAGAYSTTPIGGRDAFVARLDPARSGAAQLVFASLVGGTGADTGMAVGTHGNGVVTMCGDTKSTDLPVTPGALVSTTMTDDCWVARFDPSLTGAAQLTTLTYLGGNGKEQVTDAHVNDQGIMSIVGLTQSPDFPTTPGSVASKYRGGSDDGFLVRIDPDQTGSAQLVYGTFIGGTNQDEAYGLAVHDSGIVAISGWTWSDDFPVTPNAHDQLMDGFSDAFVWLLVPLPIGPNQLVYSTYFGGSGHDSASDVAIQPDMTVTMSGKSRSLDFPTTPGAFARTLTGNGTTPPNDPWVVRIDATRPGTEQILYSTLIGGSSTDISNGLCLLRDGSAVMVGDTRSSNFPLSNAYSTSRSGAGDAFVTQLSMLADGLDLFGNGTPGCNGPHSIGANSQPSIGNTNFRITLKNAPSRGVGVFAASTGSFSSPLMWNGVEIWIELTRQPVISFGVVADQNGSVDIPAPVPSTPQMAGEFFFAQCFWFNPAGPSPCPPGRFSATPGLYVEVKP